MDSYHNIKMNENKNLIDKLKNIFEIKQDIPTP